MRYQTLDVRFQDSVCFLKIDRPDAMNAINAQLIAECREVLAECERAASVVVLSGSPEVFCFGADFGEVAAPQANRHGGGPDALYDLWLELATGPFVTIAHVRGKTNAGGVGFVAASDIVLADETAQFSLSELLFGLYPACVLPFLVRRVGFQRAHYLTLSTQPIPARQAYEWGLVDAVEAQSEALLRRHLLRLRRLSRLAIRRYKTYVNRLGRDLAALKAPAVAANLEVFTDPDNVAAITRYAREGLLPWETP